MPMAEELGVSIYPVDSEHSAIFQCLQSGKRDDLDSLIITASWGTVPQENDRRIKTCDSRRCAESSKLVNGTKDYD